MEWCPVTRWPWRKRIEQQREAELAAEALRDRAQQQQRRVEAMMPRVDAVTSSLRALRVEAILRGE